MAPRERGSSGEPGTANSSRPGLLGEPGGDQAAGPQRRLHHHDAEGEAGDDAVPAREVAGLGCGAERGLGDHGARFGDAALQIGVLGRVGHVEAAGDRRDGAAGLHGAAVGRGVDAAREAGDHHQRARQFGGQVLRHALAVGRGVAAADQGDRAVRQQRRVAQDGDGGGCIVQQGQQRRIVRLAREDHARAKPGESAQFAHGIVGRRHGLWRRPTPGAGEARQSVQGGCGRSVARQQATVGDRADALGPGEAQPVYRVGWCRFRRFMLSDQCVARCLRPGGGCWSDGGRTPAQRLPTQA